MRSLLPWASGLKSEGAMMEPRWDERGFTLIEVLVAISILVIALLALMSMLSRGSLNVAVGGGQSKATAFARQMVEQLRNQPVTVPCFAAGCANQTDNPEAGITRTWTVACVSFCPPGSPTGNRLWRITVTVAATQSSQLAGSQNITIETMRAE